MNRATMTARLLGEASGPLSGIYIITHRTTGKRYVGQSVNIRSRWADHRRTEGNAHLARAVWEEGPDAFSFEIVELCAPEELDDPDDWYAKNRAELVSATARLDQDPALLSQFGEAVARLQSSLGRAAP